MKNTSDRSSRRHVAVLRGVGRMAIDATTGLTDLAQALHTRIARAPTQLAGTPVAGAINGVTNLVYDSVRGVTRAVGSGLDAVLAQLEPLLAAAVNDTAAASDAPSPAREALLAALNGVLGDYLARTANPLAISMAVRRQGIALTLTREALASSIPDPTGKLLVLVHGLCMNDLQWQRAGADGEVHDHGAALARDLGFTPVYLHYNSGLHVSINGRAFAGQLEALVAAWPVDVESIVIVGHSMGGLLARSAVHYGDASGQTWMKRLRALVFLGTPHHGAPLERGGHWIDVLLQSLPYTAPFARLGRVRSAGITDLRHGNVLDEDWSGHDRFAHGRKVNEDPRHPLPLPAGVACYATAATIAHAAATEQSAAAPDAFDADTLPSDGLVPVASALGRHADPRFALGLPSSREWIAWDTGHLELLSSPAVYARMRDWLAG